MGTSAQGASSPGGGRHTGDGWRPHRRRGDLRPDLPLGRPGPTGQAPPPPESVQMAVVVIALLPIVLVYPFLQRSFTRVC
jgi:hypothetical protein